jgi:1-acyl-sn-glycerol-3-phosphate acyltransferase
VTTLNTPPTALQLSAERSRRLRFTRWLLRSLGELFVTRTAMKLTITGLENVPRTGPTIVLFNHVTLLDPIVVALAVNFRAMIPLAKAELTRNPLMAWVVWAWGAIPVRRGEVDRVALRRAVEVIQSKDMLMIAPEGHRQKDGMRDPKEGVVLLAARTGAVMVPVGVSGTEHFWRNLFHLRRTPITAIFGRPFRLCEGTMRKQYAQAAHEIMYRIAPLVTPNLRGEYADLSRATMDTIELV